MNKPAATVSIDLDDLWAYRRSFGLDEGQASLLPVALPRFLDLMQRHHLLGTAFIVGRDAERSALQPALRALVQAGHEPGNHSHHHAGDIEAWPADDQHADLARAHAAIVAATGVAPVGFRGPSFRVSAGLLGTVQALGYCYDASTFPNALGALARRWQLRRAQALGQAIDLPADAHGGGRGHAAARRWPLKPYAWALPAGPLMEVPVTTLPGLRVPMHGTYLQHLADGAPRAARAYAAASLRVCRLAGVAPHLLLHATDFIGSDDPFETGFLPGMQRPWRAKVGLLDHWLRALAAHFQPMPLARYVAGVQAGPALPSVLPATLVGAA